MTIYEQAKQAKAASGALMILSSPMKNGILLAMADALEANAQYVLQENRIDVENGRKKAMPEPLVDRLILTVDRIKGMANGLRKVAALPDPVGEEDYSVKRPNGLIIAKRHVPMGVVGIIYEARPNVTADAIGLCIKSGNACVLRGGSNAIHSNMAIAGVLAKAAYENGLPQGAIQLIEDVSREGVMELMRLNGLIDILIPRGGASLIQSVVQNATVPVIETGVGNCHVYIDATADTDMAADIVYNAKCSRPGVCNAMETLLVHQQAAKRVLPAIAEKLAEKDVKLRCCPRALEILGKGEPAQESDWETEYLDYILAVRVVDSLDEAIAHIRRYSTGHSECIVTDSYENSERFLNEVDAAAVYVNASTRFTDGEEFGFGAEIGISTQKLHARGPMGLRELTTIKYVVRGNGQIR